MWWCAGDGGLRTSLVGREIGAFVFAGGVVAPAEAEVSFGQDGTQSQYGFRSVKPPTGAGDVEAVGDQVAAGTLDRAGGDRPASCEGSAVAELVEVAGQVAVAGVDSLDGVYKPASRTFGAPETETEMRRHLSSASVEDERD